MLSVVGCVSVIRGRMFDSRMPFCSTLLAIPRAVAVQPASQSSGLRQRGTEADFGVHPMASCYMHDQEAALEV